MPMLWVRPAWQGHIRKSQGTCRFVKGTGKVQESTDIANFYIVSIWFPVVSHILVDKVLDSNQKTPPDLILYQENKIIWDEYSTGDQTIILGL